MEMVITDPARQRWRMKMLRLRQFE